MVFKNLFGGEKHKRVLVCLLNAILKGRPLISSIRLVNPEHKKRRKSGKSATLDIEGTIIFALFFSSTNLNC
ncbi:MAG: Rpn family recombination-promoting nuclease/putative transposase [Endomicrobium sp.]|uniref:PD-(D/E)XK nuclease family transposase n=1 Tax=Candidatus Endomicrobiellum cubanum TaxID=3242325 RepID=UPI002837628A|nr:Rpn family recombination-promoting nuclease/putative transposase [Endomicrobium sp.]